MKEMKTLTILGNTYEVVDDKARTDIADLESQMETVVDTIGDIGEILDNINGEVV